LAGAIAAGVVRFIVMLSAQDGVFGVGTTVIVGSRDAGQHMTARRSVQLNNDLEFRIRFDGRTLEGLTAR